MLTFLILLIIFFLCLPLIRRWFAGFMRRRAEDFLRRQMGMPPRPGSREERRRQREDNGDRTYANQHRSRYRHQSSGPIIPREYAEDVEFVEYKDYSGTTVVSGTPDPSDGKRGRKETFKVESQVSDVEWEEIKITGK